MEVLTLILTLVYVGVAFGLRTLIQVRRTGRTGFVGLAHASPVEVVGGVCFVAAVVLGVLAAPLALAGISEPVTDDAVGIRIIVGGALYTVGLAATFLAQLAMGDSWRVGVDPDERTSLIGQGPFAIVRNPIFTAMVVTTVGLAILLPSVLTIAALLALVAGLEIQVRAVEEPYLRATHGAAYEDYARRVGRFVPCIGRFRAAMQTR